jgi:excisionase family DNA binding protein
MENTPKLVLLTPTELDNLIQSSVRKALSEQTNPSTQGRTFQSHEYLSIEDACIYLNLPKNTLYGYCHNNIIPFYKRGKRSYFLKSDLDTWLASGRKKTVKEIQEMAVSNFSKKGGLR